MGLARKFCTNTASTKRNADLGSGRTGAPATNLTSLLVTPLYPVSQDTVRLLNLDSAQDRLECMHVPAAGTTTLPDVQRGDTLTVASTDYRIDYVRTWNNVRVPTLHIIVMET